MIQLRIPSDANPVFRSLHLRLTGRIENLSLSMGGGGGGGGNGDVGGDWSNAGAGEALAREAPQLVAVLKEMKDGLDAVRIRVDALTQKVRQNQFPTVDGMSYLEAKHLLLLTYCQSVVYYLLRKAKGLSIEGHPVVRSLVEIRLFLEKIRPIDKKLEYQIQKLTRAASNPIPDKTMNTNGNGKEPTQEEVDPRTYRANPDMLNNKAPAEQDGTGVYRPTRFAPTSMDEDKISKQEKQALRREKHLLRDSKQSGYVKHLLDELEERPDELRESVGAESRELSKYLENLEKRSKEEEDLFTRAPVTRRDKKLEKHMQKSRNGLLGLTDSFFDEIRMLPMEKEENDAPTRSFTAGKQGKSLKKRKRKH